MTGVTRIDRVVTSGTFSLDGGTWAVDNNVWLLGDDTDVVVIDAAHDADAIVAAVAGRAVVAIACTHAHDDHVNVAPELAERLGAPIWLNPADAPLWNQTHPDRAWDADLSDGQRFTVGAVTVEVIATPGHAPGAVCFWVPAQDGMQAGALFSGDTLFQGGPGATGRSFSDFPTIIDSIRDRLLSLPADTVVYTGHGERTRIGDEAGQLADWIARGH
jgi:glyoxylase-like metal-dependent hydrolase (beta-lactamase superfamily II)